MSKYLDSLASRRTSPGRRLLDRITPIPRLRFDWKKAHRDIETETRSYQKDAAVFAFLIATLFPIAFLVDDILRATPPAYLNYPIPFVAVACIAIWLRGSSFKKYQQAFVIGFMTLAFLMTLFLPFSRNAYILIYFCFPPFTFLMLGSRRGLAASIAFFLLATVLGVLYLLGYITGRITPINSSMFAMASVSFGFQCAIGRFSEWRHSRNVDRLVERRFFDTETGLPNANAYALERLAVGEAIFLVHFENLRDLGAIAGHEEVGNLSYNSALSLLETRGEPAGRRGPYRVSETDFCFVFPVGDSTSEEATSIQGILSGLPAVMDTPLRFVTRIASYRVEAETDAQEALNEATAALSDCLATRAASLHRCGSTIENDKNVLRSRAPNLLHNIKRGLFKPAFQPVYDLERDGVGFLEALIRLDERGSAASPEGYLDAAFRLGLDSYFTEFILERTLVMALESGHSVSFNATFRDIVRPAFRADLRNAYRTLSGRDNTIIVEITEQAAIEDSSVLKEFVGEVHDLGGLVFLDDFGSGYSNYSSLLESCFDSVKTAGDIVREIAIRPEAYTLYRGMAAFCAEAGLSVIAEHISDDAILDLAVAGGARYLQGYMLARPVPAECILRGDLSFPRGFSSAPTPIGAFKAARGTRPETAPRS